MRACKPGPTPLESLWRAFAPSADLPRLARPQYQCLRPPPACSARLVHLTPTHTRRAVATPPTGDDDEFARLVRARNEKQARQRAEKAARKQQWEARQAMRRQYAPPSSRAPAPARATPKDDAVSLPEADDNWNVPSSPPLTSPLTRLTGRPPLDEEIESATVRLKDPVRGTVGAPSSLGAALAGLNRQSYVLAQLNAERRGLDVVAVCRVVRRVRLLAELQARRGGAEAAAGPREARPKTVEIHWGEEAHTVGMKLARATRFLEEGRRVEVCFKTKKRGKKRDISWAEAQKVVDRVTGALEALPRVRTWKAGEGLTGKMLQLYYETGT